MHNNHSECTGYITGWEGGIPKSIRQSRSFISEFGARNLFFTALAVFVISILILGFTGLIPGLSLTYMETQVEETPFVVITRTQTPSPNPSPSNTLEDLIIENTSTQTSSPTTTITPSTTATVTITQTATITNTATNTFIPLWTQTSTSTPRPNIPTSQPPTQIISISTSTATPSATPSETPSPTQDIFRSPTPYRTNIFTTIEYILTATALGSTQEPIEVPTEKPTEDPTEEPTEEPPPIEP